LPEGVARWLSIVPPQAAEKAGGDPLPGAAGLDDSTAESSRYMPEPRTAAVAVMCLLAFGVLLGGLTGPAAQSAGIAPIVLYASAEQAAPPATPVAETSAAPVEAPAAVVSSAPQAALPAAPAPAEAAPAPTSKPKAPLELPEEPALPPIQHVFLIVLGDNGYESAFGEASPAPYLAKTLRAKGELLPNYYAVTQGDLANEIALISGQGPTAETAVDCPTYADISPGTVAAAAEQVTGAGCVYPAATQTLPGQLAAAGKKWKAYLEGVGSTAAQPASCPHPALGGADPNQLPLPGNPYETWRNPFVYFHSLIDGPECAENDVGLEQLATDLEAKGGTPALSYIVPNACHDGSEAPCEPGKPAGLAAAEPFLQAVVPEIEASAAYKKEGGLIAITFAQAPQTETSADTSACCGTPEYPNLPVPAAPTSTTPATGPVKPNGGGGRVGMLLISPYAEPGSINETGYYNHFSLLLSIEELFGLAPLGYAAEPALTAFDSSVFNAGEEGEKAAPTAKAGPAFGSAAPRPSLARATPPR
jgi:hypothetical protein